MSGTATQNGLGPFDPYWTDDVPPSRGTGRAWRVRVALGLATAVGLVGAALYASAPRQGPESAATVAATPVSRETVNPNLAPLFTFDVADDAHAHYEARVDAATGDRRDLFSVGALDGGAPALRAEIWKRANAGAPGSLFVDIAEQAADFGAAVERLGVSQILASSQGPVEWADLTLAGGGGRRACVGFRFVARAGAGLHGVACAAAGIRMDAAALSCLVDHFALTRAGREAGLADLLKGAGARRPACRAAIG